MSLEKLDCHWKVCTVCCNRLQLFTNLSAYCLDSSCWESTKDIAEECLVHRSVDSRVVRICKWLRKSISAHLMFGNVVE